MSKTNPFESAERKAVAAARAGQPITAFSIPHSDRRNAEARVRFSRGWRNAWVQAYSAEIERIARGGDGK